MGFANADAGVKQPFPQGPQMIVDGKKASLEDSFEDIAAASRTQALSWTQSVVAGIGRVMSIARAIHVACASMGKHTKPIAHFS